MTALPDEVLCAIGEAVKGLNFGKVIIEITFHDGKPKFRIVKKISVVPGKPMSGSH